MAYAPQPSGQGKVEQPFIHDPDSVSAIIMDQGALLLIYLTAALSIIVVAEEGDANLSGDCCRTRVISLGK